LRPPRSSKATLGAAQCASVSCGPSVTQLCVRKTGGWCGACAGAIYDCIVALQDLNVQHSCRDLHDLRCERKRCEGFLRG
jgi:hypothetical protein